MATHNTDYKHASNFLNHRRLFRCHWLATAIPNVPEHFPFIPLFLPDHKVLYEKVAKRDP
jgi:hypothetical protein